MLTTTLAGLLGLLPLAFAQYNYPVSSAASSAASPASATSSGSSSKQTVAVGKGGLTFSPDTLTANVGDTIEFQFYPVNHSVSQSSFQSPCEPSGDTALFSGFMPVSSGVGTQTFTVTIKDTKPIWLYCSQAKHCEMGMAAVINAPSGKTLDDYKVAAAKVNSTVSPTVVQGGVVGSSSSSNPSGSSSAPSAKPSSGAGVTYEATGKFVLTMAMVAAVFML